MDEQFLPPGCDDRFDQVCSDTQNPQFLFCHPKSYSNGKQECPEHCPVSCTEDEDPCPGTVDATGCRSSGECVRRGQDCPVDTHDERGCAILKPEDEPNCGARELYCPGLIDSRGCMSPGTCQPNGGECPEQSFDGQGCAIYEPKTCSETQHLCQGPTDESVS